MLLLHNSGVCLGVYNNHPPPATPTAIPQDKPIVSDSKVQVTPNGIHPLPIDRPMQLEDKKMLVVFLTWTPPRFSRVVDEDSHMFLITSIQRLSTLGLLESRWADIIAYQLNGPARK